MSRIKIDEEEYWNSSKFKAFTFDDEDDDLFQLKESKRAVNSLRDIVDDDDDLEKYSWSGEPVGSISWSIKETSSSSRSAGEVRNQGQQRSQSNASAFPLSKQESSYSLSSLFKGLNKPGSLNSLSDAFTDTSVKSFAPELRRPKAEYQDYGGDWNIEDTVRRMKRGKVYSLERFRSLKDKLQLLDEAVRMHDGNVITAVLIFLKRTLSMEIFFRELEVRPVALQHFIHFLREIDDQKILRDLFRFLERVEELALSVYREHLNISNAEERRDFLKTKCIGLPFSADDAAHIEDHYTLLERQIIIEANDKHLEASGQEEIFRKHPRKASILFMPLVTTLFYSCIYHYTEGEGTFSSPANLKKTFRIPEKQYVLTALAARAKLRAWHDVDALFTTKNWLGYTKKKAPIGFHRVVEILNKNSAPVQVLQDYVRLVDDVDLRLNIAIKYKCHNVVIDTYKDLKDRHQLMVYRCKVDRNSPEEEKIDHILSNLQIRWKN
ncbi:spermatogenesis-defective protein 39 homolog [Microcaecilia unicolor]|uniref:Spermatogenesis-defective protein 39 homolog n=1 Tax=Microcaecilia unicolor TaxID=1415580 RepID=A0A6P7Z2G5_9AMPH|nr:spermatogenesis-defective protein 39 homolog [Microcaecilia unicolor]XP_030069955.1 spermatogenesis-defective protein 39 homolog [Microcaecilia unicolor]